MTVMCENVGERKLSIARAFRKLRPVVDAQVWSGLRVVGYPWGRSLGTAVRVFSLSSVVLIWAVALVRPCTAADRHLPSAEMVRTWIEQLDDDAFPVRERATQSLIEASSLAVKPVAAAIREGSPELSARGFAILEQLALSADERTSRDAADALARLANDSDTRVAEGATNLLRVREKRRSRAIETIRRLGGSLEFSGGKKGRSKLGKRWKGGDEGLRHLRDLPEFTSLDLEDSSISDAGMVHVAALTELTHLYLGDSQVQGPGLAQLKRLKKLSHLSLRNMAIDDKWLRQVGEMTQLQSLGLDDTHVTDDSILLLAKMKNLTALWLDRSQVTGVGLARLQPLAKLSKLDLDGLKLEADDLEHVAKLPLLVELSLSDTPMSDEVVAHLEKIPTLRRVHLQKTQVTRQGIARLMKSNPALKVSSKLKGKRKR